MDSRDTASAAFDVARPAGDAAGRSGLARASRGGAAPGDDRHAEQAGGLAAGRAEQARDAAGGDGQAGPAGRRTPAGGEPHGRRSHRRRRAGQPPQRPALPGNHLRRGQRRRGVDRLGLPGAQRPRQPDARDPGPRPGRRRRAGLHPGRGGPRAERRLKEIIGVVIRRPPPTEPVGDEIFQDEEESLQFPDLINRGIEVAAQNRDFNLLVSSVDVDDHDHTRRIFALARKSDGLILHDQVLDADQLERLSRQVPVVTLAGVATPTTSNVGGDNQGSMRELARHLVREHGYRTLAYLGGHPDSPDNLARQAAFSAEVAAAGGTFADGPQWQGELLRGRRRPGHRPAARQRRRGAPAGHRLRQRPDRARRRVRAHAARAGRPRGRRGDRIRRHPGRPPPAAPADHRAPAHPGTRRDRLRGALLHDQRRRARPARHRPAHPADPAARAAAAAPTRPRPRGSWAERRRRCA